MTTHKEREPLTSAAVKAKTTPPVVLITGALTGIGRATAFAFARQGARIVVSGRHEGKGKALELIYSNFNRRRRLSNPTFAVRRKFADCWTRR